MKAWSFLVAQPEPPSSMQTVHRHKIKHSSINRHIINRNNDCIFQCIKCKIHHDLVKVVDRNLLLLSVAAKIGEGSSHHNSHQLTALICCRRFSHKLACRLVETKAKCTTRLSTSFRRRTHRILYRMAMMAT